MKGKSKFVIQQFNNPTSDFPANYVDDMWGLLERAIKQIHAKQSDTLSFEELYRTAYKMVLHKHGDRLYQGLTDVVTKHLEGVAKQVAETNAHVLLKKLQEVWEDHTISSNMLTDVLMYLDRTYVPRARKTPVGQLSNEIFRDVVVSVPAIKKHVQTQLLENVQKERDGEQVDRWLFRSITQMLSDLDVYVDYFEVPFLDETRTFYDKAAQEHINTSTCTDYLKFAKKRFDDEKDRVAHYLDPRTAEPLHETVQVQLIQQHMKQLMEMDTGMVYMLEEGLVDNLYKMYDIFHTVEGGSKMLRDTMKTFVEDKGRRIVTDPEKIKNPCGYIQALLDLKDKFDGIIDEAFDNDKQFRESLKAAFVVFTNLGVEADDGEAAAPADKAAVKTTKSPEYLSLFIDEKLRKGLRGKEDKEVAAVLDKVMVIFRFLQDRDMFERYYKQHLAKRLLLGRSLSDDMEAQLIHKLKMECGHQFTSKLEGMFRDINLSKESEEEFRQHEHPDKPFPFEFNIKVLTKVFWPVEQAPPCGMPPALEKCCQVFEKFYLGKHTGRQLSWQTMLGQGELKARFKAKTHELAVNTHQMMILLLFNDKQQYSYSEITNHIKIPPHELNRQLQSLACGKSKVLTKNPKGKDVNPDDTFSFNAAFTSKMYKVKIGTVASRPESAKQSASTKTKVDDDRRHLIEAAIVRVMKARNKLDHNNLIAEVIKQLQTRFKPDTKKIKDRIESLIERDFLERSSDNMRVYHYMA